MKRLISIFFISLFILSPFTSAHAEPTVVRIVGPFHQTFNGEFRNDDLAQELTPSGKLGQLVYVPQSKSKIWVIDPALIDEVASMTGDYKLATGAKAIGSKIASNWLSQLQKVSKDNDVIALAYGNPDVALAKSLAPSELKMYYAFGKSQLQLALMRIVRSEPHEGWSTGRSKLNAVLRKNYSDNRKALTRLSRVVDSYDLMMMRLRLSRLLSPSLDKDAREYFSYSAKAAVDAEVHKLRINSGKYQVTNLIPDRATVIPQALSNPTIIAAEGFGFDMQDIDSDSILRNNPTLEGRARCPLRVQSRPFATVPYMAGGRGNQELESRLQQSEFVRTGKECGTVSETFFSTQFVPLIPHLQSNIQNPRNLVPEVAANGWIHGGIPSRQYVRDLNV